MTDQERQKFLAVRREAGVKIDPATAEVDWIYAQVMNPCGIYPEISADCVGRSYFARSPESDIWLSSGICPRPPGMRCGKSTNVSARFLQVWRDRRGDVAAGPHAVSAAVVGALGSGPGPVRAYVR